MPEERPQNATASDPADTTHPTQAVQVGPATPYDGPTLIDDGAAGIARPGGARLTVITMPRSEMPCCAGLGCMARVMAFLAYAGGGLIGTMVLLLAAAWISSALLRMAGVARVHGAYAFAMVPLTLVIMNYLLGLVRPEPPYSLAQLGALTAVVWALMLAGRGLWGRK